MSAAPTLQVEGVRVRLGAVQALDGVGLAGLPGEVLLLAGPNGAGKSTLIGVLLGLVRPDAGLLRFRGEVTRADARFRSHLGYMPEAVAFAGNATGREVLGFFARARGVDLRRVDAVLEEIGLAAAARRPVRGYSRGMRQRLGLGVAIVHEPEVLVLDEPTGGLDQDGLGLLWRLFGRFRAEGRSVWVASHELGLVERRVDRVAVLREGRLVAEGTPAALREHAGLAVKATFTLPAVLDPTTAIATAGALGTQLGDLAATAALPADPTRGEPRARLVASLPPWALAAVLQRAARWAEAAGPVAYEHVRVEEPGLDQVYEALLAEAAGGAVTAAAPGRTP